MSFDIYDLWLFGLLELALFFGSTSSQYNVSFKEWVGVRWGGVSTTIWTKRVHWPLTINKSTQLIKTIWFSGGCPSEFLSIYSFDISGIRCWHGKNAVWFIYRDTDYFQISTFSTISSSAHCTYNASWLKVVGQVHPHLKMNIQCDSPGTYHAPTMQVGERGMCSDGSLIKGSNPCWGSSVPLSVLCCVLN